MRSSVLERRVSVECEFELPADAIVSRRLVPHLGYPVELVAISNQRLPVTTPVDNPDNIPRVKLLELGSYLVWAVAGDYAYAAGRPSLAGSAEGATEEEVRSRPAASADFVPVLTAADSTGAWSNGVHRWVRIIPLSSAHYVTLYCYAGGGGEYEYDERPPSEMAKIIGSLNLRDYT